MKKMEKILLRIDEQLKAELKEEAAVKHKTLSAYIREILYERSK